jgi:hypothetical protein
LRLVLEDAAGKLTRPQILEAWPPDFLRLSDSTLYRRLERATVVGRICQSGSGRHGDPFRYWLPDREQGFQEDSMHWLVEEDIELVRGIKADR